MTVFFSLSFVFLFGWVDEIMSPRLPFLLHIKKRWSTWLFQIKAFVALHQPWCGVKMKMTPCSGGGGVLVSNGGFSG